MRDAMLSWLRRQIELDLKAARAASAGPWEIGATRGYCGREITIVGEHMMTSRYDPSTQQSVPVPTRDTIIGPGYEGGGVWERTDANHILRQQPKYVIARCEAELALLDEMVQIVNDLEYIAYGEGQSALHPRRPGKYFQGGCETTEYLIKLFAYGYRHRSGYLAEWAPEAIAP